MQPFHAQNPTFVGGEVTPRLLGRSDIERFALSSAVVENFFIRTQGPLARRRGSQIRGTINIPATGTLFSYAPRRNSAEVLMFSEGLITVVTAPIDDYSNPATNPVVEYDDEAERVYSKFGFVSDAGDTVDLRYRSAVVSGAITDGVIANNWSGQINFTRGLFSATPDERFDFANLDAVLPDHPDGEQYQQLDNWSGLDQGLFDIDGVQTTTPFTLISYPSANVLQKDSPWGSLVFTLGDEYTFDDFLEDVLSAPVTGTVPTPWTGSGFLGSYTWTSGTPAELNIIKSRYRFSLPTAEMVAGGVYRINWDELHSPAGGGSIYTPMSYSFTWNGTDTKTPVFNFPNPSTLGSIVLANITWD